MGGYAEDIEFEKVRCKHSRHATVCACMSCISPVCTLSTTLIDYLLFKEAPAYRLTVCMFDVSQMRR